MTKLSRNEMRIDSDEQALINRLEHRKRSSSITQSHFDKTTLETKPTMKRKNLSHYRPSKLSDSFMPSLNSEDSLSIPRFPAISEIQLPTEIFDIEKEMYIENERALDEPFLFEKIEAYKSGKNDSNVTADLDKQELMNYMRKNQKVNSLVVSIIVGIIIFVAVVAVILLVMNLRRAGQSSPLGGV